MKLPRGFYAVAMAIHGAAARFAIVTVMFMLVIGALPAEACSVCLTETGERVRQGIFGQDFWRNLLVTVVPFAATTGIARHLATVLAAPRKSPRRPGGARSTLEGKP
jgi:hypothetical protein